MRILFYLSVALIFPAGFGGSAKAGIIFWQLDDVVFNDGGSASGLFVDSTPPCDPFEGPCGFFPSITTTAGATLPGATYDDVCGQNVPSCTGVVPSQSEVMFLSSSFNLLNLTGTDFIVVTSPGLGQRGGRYPITIAEGVCPDPACANTPILRTSISGSIFTPEPSTCAMIFSGLLALMTLRRVVSTR